MAGKGGSNGGHGRGRPALIGPSVVLAIAGMLSVIPAAAASASQGHTSVVTSTIQAAVDAARPHDTIVVPRGIYHESVSVDKSDIAIVGDHGAVIDASGFPNGITVGTGKITTGPDGLPVCPVPAVHNATIRGVTVEHAKDNGILLQGVDGFRIADGTYRDNGEYGIFPICSAHGLIDHNRVQRSNDTGIYVGDDQAITLRDNQVSDCTAGIEIENSIGVVVDTNRIFANTGGILVFALPGLPIPSASDVLLTGNIVTSNNRPNPAAPGSDNLQGLLPIGTGILNVGADRVVISANRVTGNDTVGVAILANPFTTIDPRLKPAADDNRVQENIFLRNGRHPDLLRSVTPGADVVYDESGRRNCLSDNRFTTEYPTGVTARFACH